jgi:hypothetical protein
MISNKKAGLLVGCSIAAIVLASWAFGQAPPPFLETPAGAVDEAGAHDAATKSLQVLRNYNLSKQADAPGGNPETAVGAHFHDYIVGLEDLKKWDGKDATSILHPTGRIIFQINSKSGAQPVQSSVTVAKTGDTWNYVAFGTPKEAQARSDVLGKTTWTTSAANPADMQQVRVPSLHANFIAQRVNGVLQFTAINSLPKLNIEVGQTEPAEKVLLRMQPAAQKLDPNALN